MSSAQHIRIPVRVNPNYVKSGLKTYVSLLHKYGFKPTKAGPFHREAIGNTYELRKHHQQHHHHTSQVDPSSSQSAGISDSTGATGKVSADDVQNDSLYLTPATIGHQTFDLDFDTGSSDLWVWSTYLDPTTINEGRAAGKHIYNPSGATPMPGSTWQISYGDGSSASGVVVKDTLTLGGIVVQNQAIECADQLSSSFQNGAGDGLLGLAMGNINTVQPKRVKTPVENMILQMDIPNKLFTAYLGSSKDADEDDKGQSFFTFGYVDSDVLQHSGVSAPYYTPLVDPQMGFWKFASPSVTINGASIPRGNNTAIADTGTTLALIDDKICEAIYSAIPGARYDYRNQGYVIPANITADELPVIGFAVGQEGKVFNVSKEDLLYAETEPGYYYGGIQSRGNMDFDIFGDTWLKSVYAIFDLGQMRFGAVQRVEKYTNLPSGSSQ